jgi:BON domain
MVGDPPRADGQANGSKVSAPGSLVNARGMGILDTATTPLRQAGRVANAVRGRAMSLRSKPKDLDDVTIARKVETEIFRTRSIRKGDIDVNVVDGVVFLRGTAKNPAQVKSIEAKARTVPEVRDVQNLLHLPKTPARASKPRKTPRSQPRSVNADKTATRTGDGPSDLAKTGEGRKPAPLGSSDPPA